MVCEDDLSNPSALLAKIIAIPSVSPMGRTVDPEICFEHRLSDWLVQFFTQLGIPWERLPVVPASGEYPSRDNVLAYFDAGNPHCTMMWDVHQDTVPVDGMTIDPFAATVLDGRMYGRGAADVKGSMAAMLVAFVRLFRERPRGAANVILSCSCDEEELAQGVRELISYWSDGSEKSKLVRQPPDVIVVAEPTNMDVVVAHRGVVRWRVRTSGVACHSSYPEMGRNAIYAMIPVMEFLQQHADDLIRNGSVHPLCGGPRLSVGRIEGGSAVNIVPDQCQIEIDRRLIPGEDPQAVWESLEQGILAVQSSALCDTPWLSSGALSDDTNSDLSAGLLASITKYVPGRKRIGVPFCTNASTLGSTGIPTVVFGPGSIDQAHTCDEFIELAQVEQAAAILFDFCCHYSRGRQA